MLEKTLKNNVVDRAYSVRYEESRRSKQTEKHLTVILLVFLYNSGKLGQRHIAEGKVFLQNVLKHLIYCLTSWISQVKMGITMQF